MRDEQQRRVLVVDDSDGCASLASALQRTAVPIDEAADGRAAVELLRECSYSVVILELLLPDLERSGVFEAIAAASSSPIVLAVTTAERDVVERFDTSRIHGIVKKPYDAEDVASIIATCVELRGRSTFDAMALATMLSGMPLMALLKM